MGVFNQSIPKLNNTDEGVRKTYIDDMFDPLFNKNVRQYLSEKYKNPVVRTVAGYAEALDNIFIKSKDEWGAFGPGLGLLSNFGRTMDKMGDLVLGPVTEGVNVISNKLGNNPEAENPFTNIFVNDEDYTGNRLFASMANSMSKLAGNQVSLEESDFQGPWGIPNTAVELATDPGILGNMMGSAARHGLSQKQLLEGISKGADQTLLGQVANIFNLYDDISTKIAFDLAAPGLRPLVKKLSGQMKTLLGMAPNKDMVDVVLREEPIKYLQAASNNIVDELSKNQIVQDITDGLNKANTISEVVDTTDAKILDDVSQNPIEGSVDIDSPPTLKTDTEEQTRILLAQAFEQQIKELFDKSLKNPQFKKILLEDPDIAEVMTTINGMKYGYPTKDELNKVINLNNLIKSKADNEFKKQTILYNTLQGKALDLATNLENVGTQAKLNEDGSISYIKRNIETTNYLNPTIDDIVERFDFDSWYDDVKTSLYTDVENPELRRKALEVEERLGTSVGPGYSKEFGKEFDYLAELQESENPDIIELKKNFISTLENSNNLWHQKLYKSIVNGFKNPKVENIVTAYPNKTLKANALKTINDKVQSDLMNFVVNTYNYAPREFKSGAYRINWKEYMNTLNEAISDVEGHSRNPIDIRKLFNFTEFVKGKDGKPVAMNASNITNISNAKDFAEYYINNVRHNMPNERSIDDIASYYISKEIDSKYRFNKAVSNMRRLFEYDKQRANLRAKLDSFPAIENANAITDTDWYKNYTKKIKPDSIITKEDAAKLFDLNDPKKAKKLMDEFETYSKLPKKVRDEYPENKNITLENVTKAKEYRYRVINNIEILLNKDKVNKEFDKNSDDFGNLIDKTKELLGYDDVNFVKLYDDLKENYTPIIENYNSDTSKIIRDFIDKVNTERANLNGPYDFTKMKNIISDIATKDKNELFEAYSEKYLKDKNDKVKNAALKHVNGFYDSLDKFFKTLDNTSLDEAGKARAIETFKDEISNNHIGKFYYNNIMEKFSEIPTSQYARNNSLESNLDDVNLENFKDFYNNRIDENLKQAVDTYLKETNNEEISKLRNRVKNLKSDIIKKHNAKVSKLNDRIIELDKQIRFESDLGNIESLKSNLQELNELYAEKLKIPKDFNVETAPEYIEKINQYKQEYASRRHKINSDLKKLYVVNDDADFGTFVDIAERAYDRASKSHFIRQELYKLAMNIADDVSPIYKDTYSPSNWEFTPNAEVTQRINKKALLNNENSFKYNTRDSVGGTFSAVKNFEFGDVAEEKVVTQRLNEILNSIKNPEDRDLVLKKFSKELNGFYDIYINNNPIAKSYFKEFNDNLIGDKTTKNLFNDWKKNNLNKAILSKNNEMKSVDLLSGDKRYSEYLNSPETKASLFKAFDAQGIKYDPNEIIEVPKYYKNYEEYTPTYHLERSVNDFFFNNSNNLNIFDNMVKSVSKNTEVDDIVKEKTLKNINVLKDSYTTYTKDIRKLNDVNKKLSTRLSETDTKTLKSQREALEKEIDELSTNIVKPLYERMDTEFENVIKNYREVDTETLLKPNIRQDSFKEEIVEEFSKEDAEKLLEMYAEDTYSPPTKGDDTLENPTSHSTNDVSQDDYKLSNLVYDAQSIPRQSRKTGSKFSPSLMTEEAQAVLNRANMFKENYYIKRKDGSVLKGNNGYPVLKNEYYKSINEAAILMESATPDIVKGEDVIKEIITSKGILINLIPPKGTNDLSNSFIKNVSEINTAAKANILKTFNKKFANGYTANILMLNTDNLNIKKDLRKFLKDKPKYVPTDLVFNKSSEKAIEKLSDNTYKEIVEIYKEAQNLSEKYYTMLGLRYDNKNYFKHSLNKSDELQRLLNSTIYKGINLDALDDIYMDVYPLLDDFGAFFTRNTSRRFRGNIGYYNTFFKSGDTHIPMFSTIPEVVIKDELSGGSLANSSFQTTIGLFTNKNFRVNEYCQNVNDLKRILFAKDNKGEIGGNANGLLIASPSYTKDGRIIGFKRYNPYNDKDLERALNDKYAIITPVNTLATIDSVLKRQSRLDSRIYQFINKNFTLPFKLGALTNIGFLLGNASDAFTKQIATFTNKYGTSVMDEVVNFTDSVKDVIKLNNTFEDTYEVFLKDYIAKNNPNMSIAEGMVFKGEMREEFFKWLYNKENNISDTLKHRISFYFRLNENDVVSEYGNVKDYTKNVKNPNVPNYNSLKSPWERITLGKESYDKNNIKTWGIFANNPVFEFMLGSSNKMESIVRQATILNDIRHKEDLDSVIDLLGTSKKELDNIDKNDFPFYTFENKVMKDFQMYNGILSKDAANFNYENTTGLIDTLGTVMPFPTFFIKNIGYWLDLLMEKPTLLKKALILQEGLWSGEPETKTDRFKAEAKGRGAIPLNLTGSDKISSFFKGIYKPSMLNSMFSALSALNNPVDSIQYRLHPLLSLTTYPLNDKEDVKYRPYSMNQYEKNIDRTNPKFSNLEYLFHRLNPFDKVIGNTLRLPSKIKNKQVQLADVLSSTFQPDF